MRRAIRVGIWAALIFSAILDFKALTLYVSGSDVLFLDQYGRFLPNRLAFSNVDGFILAGLLFSQGLMIFAELKLRNSKNANRN